MAKKQPETAPIIAEAPSASAPPPESRQIVLDGGMGTAWIPQARYGAFEVRVGGRPFTRVGIDGQGRLIYRPLD